MKSNMFKPQDLEQFNATLAGTPGRYQTVLLPGVAGRLNFALDTYFTPKIEAGVVRRTLSFAAHANAIDRLTSSGDLSPSGILNARRSLQSRTAELAAQLEGDAATVANVDFLARLSEEHLYEAPPIENGDFASVMADSDIRRHWDSMDMPRLDTALRSGELTQRHVEAMVRSPVALREPMLSVVAERWEAFLREHRAKQWASVQDDRSSATWGVAAVGQLRAAVDRLQFSEVGDALSPITVGRREAA